MAKRVRDRSDGDGLWDLEERKLGTDPNNSDSDGDGVRDGVEARVGTDPTVADRSDGTREDSDADGLRDVEEAAMGTDPTNPDSDGEGKLDGEETVQSGGGPTEWSDPSTIDTDHDGVNDRDDDHPTTPDAPESIPDWLRDSDEDGTSDQQELEYGTDPHKADTDGDGFSDRIDVAPRRPNVSNDPLGDYDGDGASNADEKTFGSDPFDADSFGRGLGDRAEVDVAVRDRAAYQAETSGPIGYLATLQMHGTAPTAEEEAAARAAIEEAINSDNIMSRERGYEARRDLDGTEPPPEHTRAFEEFTRDRRDADVDRDPEAFARALEAQNGRPPSAGELDAFRNPSPSDLVGAGRASDLLGVDIPAGSALATAMTDVLAGVRPGTVAPTSTGPARPGEPPGTGSTPGSGTTPNSGTPPSSDGSEPPVDRSDLPIGGDAGGGVVVKDPATGNTMLNREDGSATTWGPGGEVTYDSRAERAAVAADDSASNWKNYLDTPLLDTPASDDPGAADPDADDEGPDDEGDEEEDQGDEPDGEEGEDAEDEGEDEEAEEDNDDQDEEEEGMTDPDAGTSDAGLAGGQGGSAPNPDELISSTRGTAVTNTGRDDLDWTQGEVTGELHSPHRAGPDVNPDAEGSDDGGSLRAPAPADGVNPDLLDTIGPGPVEPPEDDGVNPYAAGATEGTPGTSGSGDPRPPGEMDGSAGVVHADLNADVVAGPSASADPDGTAGPGYGSGPRPPGDPDSSSAGADDVLGMAPAAAAPVAPPAPTVEGAARAASVDAAAAAPVESAVRAAPAPDLVAAGLVADLGADPASALHDLEPDAHPGLGTEHPDDYALDEDGSTFDAA